MSIFRDLFGPPFRECWQEFSQAVGGSYEETGFWGEPRARFQHGPFTIVLDRYVVSHGKSSTTYTRFRAAYRELSGLRLKLYRTGLFTSLAMLFGAQNLNIGDPAFDEAFVLKGNDPHLLTRLFAHDELRRRLSLLADPKLEICQEVFWFRESLAPGEAELRYVELGITKNTEQLKCILDLMKECLDRLCEVGVANAVAPSTVF